MTSAALLLSRPDQGLAHEYVPPTPSRRAFAFRNVKKSFGDKPVLQGIDLDVPAGQFLAIIGRSGCGKSTLLRILAGLEQPSSGQLIHDIDEASFAQTRFMFQEPRLLPWKTVIQNVEVGVKGANSRADTRDQARAILNEVGLGDRQSDWPSILSGGQKQRVALARAVVGNPQILALDEPLGALDALTRIEMQGLLSRIWTEKKFTAVLVTHDVTEAVMLADRVVVIDAGRIALDLPIDVARPRRHGEVELAKIEGEILGRLFEYGCSAP